MNKKILSIFALIMALSFAVSCSNEETTGTGGDTTKTVTATVDSLKKAAGALGGDSDSLVINDTGSKTISSLASKTVVTVDANTITITITDAALNTASDGSKANTKANIEKVLDGLKTEMKKQGVNITAANAGTATDESDIGSAKAVSFTLAASKVADTETTKYVLPKEITNLQNIKIVIAIGSGTGSWA